MKPIETTRLLLRKFKEDDFAAVQAYAGCAENLTYMMFGPNTEDETRDFMRFAIAAAEKDPINCYELAVVLKETDVVIGGCSLSTGDKAEVGWILHRDHWHKGYGSEIGSALLKFGFEKRGLHRIVARCDAENVASAKLMEKIGMRREGLFLEARPANKKSTLAYGDELRYAILRDEWETYREVEYYNTLSCVFDDFIDVPTLSDDEIFLVCTSKVPGNPEEKKVPCYFFAVCKSGEVVGEVSLRIGYSPRLYFGGNIAYATNEKHRGKGYAVRACQLLAPIARAHGMEKLLITNNTANDASRRVCEKLGARLLRVARIPEWHDLYRDGQRFENIFEWTL